MYVSPSQDGGSRIQGISYGGVCSEILVKWWLELGIPRTVAACPQSAGLTLLGGGGGGVVKRGEFQSGWHTSVLGICCGADDSSIVPVVR